MLGGGLIVIGLENTFRGLDDPGGTEVALLFQRTAPALAAPGTKSRGATSHP
ncbi:MAG: hypothetical protein U0570_06655 [Phycisphaerales bacterium]